jgi:hypothetical protein
LGYLAREIVALKNWDRNKTLENTKATATPPPYGRKVDVWAPEISAYTIYTEEIMDNPCSAGNIAIEIIRC